MEPKLAALHRQLNRHKRLRAKYAKQKRWGAVKQENAEIARLTRLIDASDGKGGARRPEKRSAPGKKAPLFQRPGVRRAATLVAASMVAPVSGVAALRIAMAGGPDKYATLIITPKNAEMLVSYYGKLLKAAKPHDPRRAIYRLRLLRAQSVLARAHKRPVPTAYKEPRDVLREKARAQRRLAEAARRRKDYAAVQRHQEMVESFERQAETQRLAPLPPPPPRSPVPEGALPFVPREGAESSAPSSESSEESEVETSDDDSPPWYKRPLVWLVIAGAAGAAFALKKGKKGSSFGGSAPSASARKRVVFRGGTKSTGASAPFLP